MLFLELIRRDIPEPVVIIHTPRVLILVIFLEFMILE